MFSQSPLDTARKALARRSPRRTRRIATVVAVATALALGATACSSGGSTPDSTSGSSASVDQTALKAAQEAVAKVTGPQDTFTGPTTGFKPEAGKKIVYVSCGQANTACPLAGQMITDVAKKIGWTVTTIDGKSSVSGWLSAFNQAIALKPDGIMELGIDPTAIPAPFAKAKQLGIPIVSIFALPKSGPDPAGNVFYNEGQDGEAVGEAMANAAIADSGGTARVILLYDDIFALSRAKTAGFKKVLNACKSCTILESVNSPIASVAQDGPGQISGWVNKYGSKPFYVLTVGDVQVDALVPTLKSRSVDPSKVKLYGADGTEAAYERIRSGQYEIGTVANPYLEVAYNTIDQMIRAQNHADAFNWVPDPYIVTKSNIDKYGGDKNAFVPGDDFESKYLTLWGVK